ncbi:unnamed protein product, partial [marine sediment metagenome]
MRRMGLVLVVVIVLLATVVSGVESTSRILNEGESLTIVEWSQDIDGKVEFDAGADYPFVVNVVSNGEVLFEQRGDYLGGGGYAMSNRFDYQANASYALVIVNDGG